MKILKLIPVLLLGLFWLAIIISAVTVTGIAIHSCVTQSVTSFPIESASMTGGVEGTFGLFGGTLNGEAYYFFYAKEEEGLRLYDAAADRTIIIETEDEPPHFERVVCGTDKLYVPEGTVMLEYGVMQPGLEEGLKNE